MLFLGALGSLPAAILCPCLAGGPEGPVPVPRAPARPAFFSAQGGNATPTFCPATQVCTHRQLSSHTSPPRSQAPWSWFL